MDICRISADGEKIIGKVSMMGDKGVRILFIILLSAMLFAVPELNNDSKGVRLW